MKDCLFLTPTSPAAIYTLSLHDALPISIPPDTPRTTCRPANAISLPGAAAAPARSEEHTSELQSRRDLVCRLLLEKKKNGHRHHRRAGRGATANGQVDRIYVGGLGVTGE